MRVLYLAAAAAVLAGAGCGSSTSPSDAPKTFSVSGRLLTFASGTPVPGRHLQFTPAAGGAAIERDTGADGGYTLPIDIPPAQQTADFTVSLDGRRIGDASIGRPSWRGDLLEDEGCVARYGVVLDAATGAPVSGALVTLGGQTVSTGSDGWYRIDLGCPDGGILGFNTAFIQVTHTAYATLQRVVGRGIPYVERLDLQLSRQ